jgi:hypothetical protein
VDEWRIKVGNRDNHLLDAVVGCAVAASMGGSALPENSAVPAVKKPRVSFADMRNRKRGA